MPDIRKGTKDEFAHFFENPSRESLRDLLQHHLGETDNADFKRNWQDGPKVARHVLAMANSGGGAIFVGVEQEGDGSYTSVGVKVLMDKADLHQHLEKYLPDRILYRVYDFTYEASEYPVLIGKKFQVLLVEDTPRYIPFLAMADGDHICKGDVYVRNGTRSTRASYEELQDIINRRIETGYSSSEEFALDEHLSELKSLYGQIPRYVNPFGFGSVGVALHRQMMMENNPEYPEETFIEFVREMIAVKKQIIRQIVGRS